MKNLDLIAEELFNKIRGRFPSITIGNENGEVTNVPSEARFYDFEYKEGDKTLGKISVTLTDSSVAVMYSNDFVTNEDQLTKDKWYNFLRELRSFAKKRLLNFDTRDITKTNLDTRDYKFLATNRPGDITMESKMYGTNKTSYQNVGNARITIKHSKPVNVESATGRIQNVSAIYIESAEGERFKYPIKHLNGARAMARHVSEGGKPYDDFGTHITGLSEELGKLKKFKSYVNRSSVMAEGLGGYVDVVNERISEVKKTVERLQKESFYKEAFDGFETPVLEDVPSDVAENWIDQLTVKQFNEELKDVFPYIYRLIGEATRAKELGPNDLLGEVDDVYPPRGDMEMDPSNMRQPEQDFIYTVKLGDTVSELAEKLGIAVEDIVEINGLNSETDIRAGQQLRLPGDPDAENIGAGGTRELGPNGQMTGSTRGVNPPPQNIGAGGTRELGPNGRMTGSTRGINPGESFEEHMNSLMGQFGDTNEIAEAAVPPGFMMARIVRKPISTGQKRIGQQMGSNVGDDSRQSFINTAIFGNFQDPLELTQKTAEYSTAVRSPEHFIKIAQRLIDDRLHRTEGVVLFFTDVEADTVWAPYVNAIKELGNPKIQVSTRGTRELGGNDKAGKIKSRGSDDGAWANPDARKSAPGKKQTYVFRVENKKLVDFLKKKQPDYMIKFYKPATNEFVMSEKTFEQFKKTINSPKWIKKFGESLIMINREKSFAETTESEHGSEQKTPLPEFILSYFDRNSGQFPKGETAVLTMVEKDYGEQFITPAKQFIEMINNRVAEMHGYRDTDLEENPEQDLNQEILGFARYLMGMDRQLGYRASDLMRQHPGQPEMALQALQSDPEIAKLWQSYSSMPATTNQPQSMNTRTNQPQNMNTRTSGNMNTRTSGNMNTSTSGNMNRSEELEAIRNLAGLR